MEGTITSILTLIDPCLTTVFNEPANAIGPIISVVGSSGSVDFDEITDTAATIIGLETTFCGTRKYSIDLNWVIIQTKSLNTTYTITANPPGTDDSLVKDNTAKLTVTFANLYTSIKKVISITITVNYAACSCAGLVYESGDEPSVA